MWCSSFLSVCFVNFVVALFYLLLMPSAQPLLYYSTVLHFFVFSTNKLDSQFTHTHGTDCSDFVNAKTKKKFEHLFYDIIILSEKSWNHFSQETPSQCIFHPYRIDFCFRRKKKQTFNWIFHYGIHMWFYFRYWFLFGNFVVTRTLFSIVWFCSKLFVLFLFFFVLIAWEKSNQRASTPKHLKPSRTKKKPT